MGMGPGPHHGQGGHDGHGPHSGPNAGQGPRADGRGPHADGRGPRADGRGPGQDGMHGMRRAGRNHPPMGPMGPMRPSMGGGHGEMMHELAMLGVHLYPPPMVVARAKELGLTPEQVTKIRDEVVSTHKRAIDLHGKIEHAKLEAARLLATDKVDERAMGAQIDEAAKAEAELHKLHVGLMVHVRALLTAEQRQKLDEKRMQGPPGGAHPGMGPVGQADDDDDDCDEECECDDAHSA